MNPVERIWDDTCNIYKKDKIIDPIDHSTTYGDVMIYENQKCRISRNSSDVVKSDGTVVAKGQGISLFISETLDIPAGCKIRVTHMGETKDYARSGEPFKYKRTHHQEIPLELFKKYA